MSEYAFEIAGLITRRLRGQITPEELSRLNEWLNKSAANKILYEQLLDDSWVDSELKKFGIYDEQKGREKIHERLVSTVGSLRRSEFRKLYFRVAAAAVLVLLAIGAWYFIFMGSDVYHNELTQTADVSAPVKTKAVITLANGKTISLDDISSGMLALQGNVTVTKSQSGEVIYNMTRSGPASAEVYNTLFNPKGSRAVTLVLADGTKVWVNAESSISYPVVFQGKERKVRVSGEVYFEVNKRHIKGLKGSEPELSGLQPFLVVSQNVTTRVLGTHFNVNAYPEESGVKVTLLEGAVMVSTEKGSVKIKPGEQAAVDEGKPQIIKNVDLDAIMAWKNGEFHFDHTTIRTIMNQVERWYDVEIQMKGNFDDLSFGGHVSRTANVSELLRRLEATEELNFEIEGKKITVTREHR